MERRATDCDRLVLNLIATEEDGDVFVLSSTLQSLPWLNRRVGERSMYLARTHVLLYSYKQRRRITRRDFTRTHPLWPIIPLTNPARALSLSPLSHKHTYLIYPSCFLSQISIYLSSPSHIHAHTILRGLHRVAFPLQELRLINYNNVVNFTRPSRNVTDRVSTYFRPFFLLPYPTFFQPPVN